MLNRTACGRTRGYRPDMAAPWMTKKFYLGMAIFSEHLPPLGA
jgi:hypothetical protein